MKKTILLAGVMLLSLVLAPNVSAIGMITEPIAARDMLRGGEVSKTVTLFNPQDTEATFELGSSGEITGWVEFFESGKTDTAVSAVSVPPKYYYDVVAKIKVPEGTPNGEYLGEIFVKDSPKEQTGEEESSVGVAQMVSTEVLVTVTDREVIELDTTLIPESFTVQKGEPLKIKIVYENLGNVSLRPSFQLKVLSSEDESVVFNAIYPYADTEEAVKPGETKTMPVFEWPTAGQKTGRYFVEAVSLVDGEAMGTEDFRFSIKDSLAGGAVLGAFISSIGGGNAILGWVIAGAALLVLLIMVRFVFSKKRKISSSRMETAQKSGQV
ncbi:MAG: hypothetical protein COT92_03805 [Candidatus Doudnabacteria bacterium CG10_big_fil_rev_8_21_14_0_10_42_18]|uniref:CARDB domain-containing protein n=1 Tax=Candidatus Doudnabacteria bacterium CG10_big_fil_rev_8_21_14_0_10_42_18 TaxID=1974552 RepID=A0A2H0VA58_9BACT|nr:MAG: hypothetical protein COT92_03805 [Candidatus Doudnabacteria bacterium CG10_big_fil_rev_8_21_14_0_10_42_18]